MTIVKYKYSEVGLTSWVFRKTCNSETDVQIESQTMTKMSVASFLICQMRGHLANAGFGGWVEVNLQSRIALLSDIDNETLSVWVNLKSRKALLNNIGEKFEST